MAEINSGLILGLAGALCGAMMAALAFAMSRAPGWRELRSFALVALLAATYCFFGLVHVTRLSESALLIGERLLLAASFGYGMAWIRHLAISDGRALGRLEKAALLVGAVMVVLALIPGLLVVPPVRTIPVEWFGVTYTMGTGTTLGVLCVAYILVATTVAAFGRGRRWRDGWHSRLPMIGATALALTGVIDTVSSMQIISMPQMIEGVTVAVVGMIGVSYAQRFIADARRLEALSTKLEHEVASRTDELMKAQAVAAHHEKLAGLGRIAAGVAHEINNPTTVVQQNLDRMQSLIAGREGLSPEITARIERSRVATQRIADIVRQLLEAGRPPTADTASSTLFTLAPVVERAIAAAAATAPGLEVTVSVAESLRARGDAGLLEQVLINLLVNSAHATNHIAGRARIEGVRVGERVRLTVTDNGSGIPAAIGGRLFEPFTTTKPVGQGTGLGLAVSRGLMTRQGGALYVARSTSEGTEMAVELPATDATEAPPAVVTAAPGPGARTDLHVLVIDDNEDLREVLTLQLNRFFRVDEAATVDQALEMVAGQNSYDVVLCDLMMPSGGAESWLSRCGSIDPRLEERTILLTGGPTTEAARALVEARRGKVMLKPVEIADLRPMIERIASD